MQAAEPRMGPGGSVLVVNVTTFDLTLQLNGRPLGTIPQPSDGGSPAFSSLMVPYLEQGSPDVAAFAEHNTMELRLPSGQPVTFDFDLRLGNVQPGLWLFVYSTLVVGVSLLVEGPVVLTAQGTVGTSSGA